MMDRDPRPTTEEQQRLDTLCALQLLDTSADARFDRITRIVAKLFQVPIALVSMVDDERQWLTSRYGLEISESSPAMSFCIHALRNGAPLVVPDTLEDPRFSGHPMVLGAPHVRFYAGCPVHGPEGHALGTLSIIDTRPRADADIDLESLRNLADMVEEEIRKSVIAARAMTRDEELNAALRHLSSHIHNSPLAVVQWDHAMRIVSWSDRAEELFGWSAERMLGMGLGEAGLVHAEDVESVLANMRQLLQRRGLRNVCHSRSNHRDGRLVHCAWHNSILFAEDGAPISILSLVQDVTAQRNAELALQRHQEELESRVEQRTRELQHSNAVLASEVQQRLHAESVLRASEQKLHALARMDTLTELPNRRYFNEKLDEALRRCSRTGQTVGLMFLDVDHFKRINDTLGHGGGDVVLQEFARRLSGAVRATDSVCRLAGDEFTIILENLAAPAEAVLVAGKILDAVRRPFNVDGTTLAVSTSIGIACNGPGGQQAQLLTRQADQALYKAKELGRNQAYLADQVEQQGATPAVMRRLIA